MKNAITLRKLEESYSFRNMGATRRLKKSLGIDYNQDAVISLSEIFEKVGALDTYDIINFWDYKDYCLLVADIAEYGLPTFEKRNDSKDPRNAIEGVREWKKGNISKQELTALGWRVADSMFSHYKPSVCAAHMYTVNAVVSAVTTYLADVADLGGWDRVEDDRKNMEEINKILVSFINKNK